MDDVSAYFPTMKSIGADKAVSAADEKAADENLEEAKEHLESALKSRAAAAATLGAGLVAKISKVLEDAAENMKADPHIPAGAKLY